MRTNSLFYKMSKCYFAGLQVEYLGHIIIGQGVSTDPSKVVVIALFPKPMNIKQLRGFIGLSGYYRRFIQAYSTINKPLTEMLRNNNFRWSTSATSAFEQLKKALQSTHVLDLPDVTKQFVVEMDASTIQIGAVLMQACHPIAYISKTLSACHQALLAYENELLAIPFPIKKWHYFLIDHRFIIRTDQES